MLTSRATYGVSAQRMLPLRSRTASRTSATICRSTDPDNSAAKESVWPDPSQVSEPPEVDLYGKIVGGGGDGGGGSGGGGGDGDSGDAEWLPGGTGLLAVFFLAGGVFGYSKGSKKSLLAGAMVAGCLGAAVVFMNNPATITVGYLLALGTTLLLTVGMTMRYASTRKLWPAGTFAVLSLFFTVNYLTCGKIVV